MIIPKIMITLNIVVGTTKTENIDIRKKSDIPIVTIKDNLGIMVFKKSPPVQYNVFFVQLNFLIKRNV